MMQSNEYKEFVTKNERASHILPVIIKLMQSYQKKFSNAKTTKELYDFDIFRTAFDLLCNFEYLNQFERISSKSPLKQGKLRDFIGKIENALEEFKEYDEKYF